MSNQLLFRRYARLVISDLDILGLDFTFSIEKSLEEAPNRLELVVYNLSETHRRALQKKTEIPFLLHLGYLGVDQETPFGSINLFAESADARRETLMFKGTLQKAITSRDGPDWITVLIASDAIDAHIKTRINKSYSKDIPYVAIAQDLIRQLGTDSKAALARMAAGGFDGSSASTLNSYVASGSVARELERVLTRFNLSYSIQNGELVILGKEETRNQNPILLTPETGLIGSPQPGKDGIVQIRSLILPQLTPGKKVKLETEQYNGLFKIERAVYTGSTFGNEWYIDMDGTPL